MTGRDGEWLTAHNSRRRAYHETRGEKYRPLVWSPMLAKAASNWIDVIMPTCKITREGIEEGENMSTRKTNGARDEGPEVLLARWVDKPLQNGAGYPDNQSMTQALWRATRYVGCGDGVTTSPDGSRCYVSICRYARAGRPACWPTDPDAARRVRAMFAIEGVRATSGCWSLYIYYILTTT
jgi:hypothetical protein